MKGPRSGGSVWPRDPVLWLCRRLLRFAARDIPLLRRGDWLAEWEGELWTVHRRGGGRPELLRFAWSALGEARWEKREEEGAMGGFGQDVRLAARRLRRRPGLAVVVVAVLALGIGANAALFSALKAVLLSSSPYRDADRLVMVDLLLEQRAGAAADTMPWSYPKFASVRERLRSVESLAGFVVQTGALTGVGEAARVGVEYVTPAYFEVLGIRAHAGRTFGMGEEVPAPAAVALLSHGVWTSRYGGDPAAIGTRIVLDGAPLEVVGVLPPGFRGVSGAADVFVPVAGIAAIRGPRRLEMAWAHWLHGIGRLAPGASLEQARAEADVVGTQLTAAYPDPSGGGTHGVAVVPFLNARVNDVARIAVAAVSAGAVLLLLIACANVGGLLLADGAARRTDMAVRGALGAGRSRLLRESLIEHALLAAAAGALGLFLAWTSQRLVAAAVRHALDTSGTRTLQFIDANALGADGGVLVAGVALTFLAILFFGLVPARMATRPDLARDLRAATGAVGRRHDAAAWRGLLVAGQLALTLVLLAGAGLMGASLAALSRIDPGFSDTNVLTVRYERGPAASPEQDRAFEERLLERVRAIPGVARAGIAPCAPLAGRCEVVGLRQIDDRPPVDYGDMEGMLGYSVSADYFATLGIRVVEGRTFGPADLAGAPAVAVINQAAAAKYFPGVSAVGHRIAVTHTLTESAPAEIVGVVADVRYAALEEPAMPALYFTRAQDPSSYGTLFVAGSADADTYIDGVRRVAADLDPTMPLYDMLTMANRKAAGTARTRVVLWLLAAFAATGLLLSAIGLYGTVSYAVQRRTRELGLRAVLGAARADVVRLVLTPPMLLAGAGAALGIVAAAGLTRFAGTLLYGVAPGDALVLGGAALLLIAVAFAAAWLPARRATRIAPAAALREE